MNLADVRRRSRRGGNGRTGFVTATTAVAARTTTAAHIVTAAIIVCAVVISVGAASTFGFLDEPTPLGSSVLEPNLSERIKRTS